MWFAGVRRISYLFLVGLLLISVLFMWACSNSCRVESAIPTPSSSFKVPTTTTKKAKLSSYGVLDNKSRQDLVHKYFRGTRAFGPPSIKTTQKGFDDSKRRVPSCPDPLHN